MTTRKHTLHQKARLADLSCRGAVTPAAIPAAIAAALLISTSTMAVAETAVANSSSLEQAITGGKTSVNLRLRAEAADRDGFDQPSSALTLRSRLGYTTANFHGFSISGELENVSAAGGEAYASRPSEIGGSGRFIIADPTGTEVNQAYLKYQQGEHAVIAGRQRVVVNNARVVGNVGWRQNEQTFDGLSYQGSLTQAVDLELYYLNKSQFIFFNTIELDSTALANVKFSVGAHGKLVAYGFWYGVEDGGANNSKTFGLRYSARYPLANWQLGSNVEFARQLDYSGYQTATGSTDFAANYANVDFSIQRGGVSLLLGYELLGSDEGRDAVSFPLATNHKFNGWADVFLFTPSDGLRDVSVGLGAKFGRWNSKLIYHRFSADHGGASYGSEVDLLLVRPLAERLKLVAKLAFYNADEFQADTQRASVDLNYAF